MDENKKREGLSVGRGRQLIRPCTGDVRSCARTFRSTLALRPIQPIKDWDQNVGESGRCFGGAIQGWRPSKISLVACSSAWYSPVPELH